MQTLFLIYISDDNMLFVNMRVCAGLCVCVCAAQSAVYGDYESRWTDMLTGEGSLTLGVSVLTLMLLLLSLISQLVQQPELLCMHVCACVCEHLVIY